MDNQALEARAAAARAPDNEELRAATDTLQNEAAAVSRAREERSVHHLPAEVQAWYNTEVTNGCWNPHERPSYPPEHPGLFPIVDAVGLNLTGAQRHEWNLPAGFLPL